MDLVFLNGRELYWFFLILELENLLKKGLGRVNFFMENDYRFYYWKSLV